MAVSAETSGSGKAGLRVFGVGAEGQGEHKTGHANRINFSVPVRLPDGKQMPKERSDYNRDASGRGWQLMPEEIPPELIVTSAVWLRSTSAAFIDSARTARCRRASITPRSRGAASDGRPELSPLRSH